MEIPTFEWVTWWNESRLHQSLGYRTPTEVETKFWEHNPDHGIMENKAHAKEQKPGHFTTILLRPMARVKADSVLSTLQNGNLHPNT